MVYPLVSESGACFVCVSEFPAGFEVPTPLSQTEEMAREVTTFSA